jgi:hypothetical protein
MTTTTAPRTEVTTPSQNAFRILRLGFTVAPILFGLDKFFNVMANWPEFLPNFVTDVVSGTVVIGHRRSDRDRSWYRGVAPSQGLRLRGDRLAGSDHHHPHHRRRVLGHRPPRLRSAPRGPGPRPARPPALLIPKTGMSSAASPAEPLPSEKRVTSDRVPRERITLLDRDQDLALQASLTPLPSASRRSGPSAPHDSWTRSPSISSKPTDTPTRRRCHNPTPADSIHPNRTKP